MPRIETTLTDKELEATQKAADIKGMTLEQFVAYCVAQGCKEVKEQE